MSLSGPPLIRCALAALGEIDADAANPAWQAIVPVELKENLTGNLPAEQTRVRVASTADAWRVLFEVESRAPWATITQRDGPLWTEEVVEILVDPFSDGFGYFEIELNPLGTVVDLVLRRTATGWRKDFAWDVDSLRTAVRRTESGWNAELSIPFASLGANPANPPVWRVNFLRIARPGGPGIEGRELSAWSPTGAATFHRYERFGTMEFVSALL